MATLYITSLYYFKSNFFFLKNYNAWTFIQILLNVVYTVKIF
jgi:hypothetical protein